MGSTVLPLEELARKIFGSLQPVNWINSTRSLLFKSCVFHQETDSEHWVETGKVNIVSVSMTITASAFYGQTKVPTKLRSWTITRRAK